MQWRALYGRLSALLRSHVWRRSGASLFMLREVR